MSMFTKCMPGYILNRFAVGLFLYLCTAAQVYSQEAGVTPPPVEAVAAPAAEPSTAEPVFEVITERPAIEAGRFSEPLTGRSEPQYLSRETPLYLRFRQAMQAEQPTFGRPLAATGRFGQGGAQEYGDIEEGPGFV
ncbi:MAG: hypothetical protein ACKO0V_20230, partial [bacterium]